MPRPNVYTGFEIGLASNLKSAIKNAIEALNTAQATLNGGIAYAQIDFAGRFADVYAQNMDIQRADKEMLVASLTALESGVTDLEEAAEAEQKMIDIFNAWEDDHNRWLARRPINPELIPLWLANEPLLIPPSARYPGTPPAHSIDQPALPQHDTPMPGSGGGGSGGRSSCYPANLYEYVLATRSAHDTLESHPRALQTAVSAFVGGWKFGSLSGGESIAWGINDYIRNNDNDADWIDVVRQAFKEAGEGGPVLTLLDSHIDAVLDNAGLDAGRKAIQVAWPCLTGQVVNSALVSDPVNSATGNFLEPELDISFPEGCQVGGLSRMYNSILSHMQHTGAQDAPARGVFGIGWVSVLDQCLVERADHVVWMRADGQHVYFPVDAERFEPGSGVVRAEGENFWLRAVAVPGDSEGVPCWEVSDNTGQRWVFTRAGAWIEVCGRVGFGVRAERDRDGLVSALVTERGRRIDIEYRDGRVVVARGWDGTRFEYHYEGEHLVGASGPHGTRRYEIDDAGLVARVVATTGVVECVNVYDGEARVVKQTSEHGRDTHFAYLPGRVTVVSDGDGTRSNTWVADSRGRTIAAEDSDGNRQTMSYDRHGNLLRSRDRDNKVTTHFYDERGHLVRTVSPAGGELTASYDEQDRLVEAVGPTGLVARYEYEGDSPNPSRFINADGAVTSLEWVNGLLVKATDPTGVFQTIGYNDAGEVISFADALGNTYRMERDSAGRVVEMVTPLGFTTRLVYNADGTLARRIDPDGATTTVDYDVYGRPVVVTDPGGAKLTLVYSEVDGRVEKIIDPLGHALSNDVDDLGNLRSITMPDGDEFTFVFDALSRLRQVADPVGHAWKFEYDAVGDLSTVIDPAGVTTRTVRDSQERTATSVDSQGNGAVMQFDQFGRPVASYDTATDAAVVTYDTNGNVTEMLDAQGGLTTLDYDAAGRVVSMTSPGGKVTDYTYGPSGRLEALTTAEGVTSFEYDADSRVVATVNTAGERSTFEYDSCGRLLRARVAGRGTSEFRYDSCGRVTYSRDILTGIRYFRYDAAGNLVSVRNGLGGITRYEYDVRNRLVRVVDPAGGVTKRVYDSVDNLVSVTDPLGRTVSVAYDELGNPLSRTGADGTVTSFEYKDGAVTKARIGDQEVACSDLNYDDRTLTLTDASHNRYVFTYDRLGRLISQNTTVAGQERCSTWTYGKDGERTSYTPAGGATYRYGYDAVGNLATITHPELDTVRFGYDPMGRVTHMVAGEDTHQWAYKDGFVSRHTHTTAGVEETTRVEHDSWGRVTSVTTGSEKVTYEYGGDGQLVAAVSTSGATKAWEYDQAARIIRFIDGDTVSEYTYDSASQLVERRLTSPQGTSHTVFAYDADGHRVSETVDGELARRLRWDASGSLAGITEVTDGREHDLAITLDALGNPIGFDGKADIDWDYASPIPTVGAMSGTSFMSLPGGVMLSPQGVETLAGSSWRAGRGTDPMSPFASPGVVSGLSGYLPEGVDMLGTGSLRVGGMEWMGERLYDPATQAFLSPDPLAAPAGTSYQTNPYNFAANNPLALMDPLGLSPATDTYFGSMLKGLRPIMDRVTLLRHAGRMAFQEKILKPVGNFLQNGWNWLKGTFNATVNWVKVHWEDIKRGALIVGGIALVAVGIFAVPALVGTGLAAAVLAGAAVAGGANMTTQAIFKPANQFSFSEFALSTVVGGATGGLGKWVGDLGIVKNFAGRFGAAAPDKINGVISGMNKLGQRFLGKTPLAKNTISELSKGGREFVTNVAINGMKSFASDAAKETTSWAINGTFENFVENGQFKPNYDVGKLTGNLVKSGLGATGSGIAKTKGLDKIGIDKLPQNPKLKDVGQRVLNSGGQFAVEMTSKEIKNLGGYVQDRFLDGDPTLNKKESHAEKQIKAVGDSLSKITQK
ncbi:MAG: DUF6531 domain-containing protein [Actinotignum sanguinis]|uniref:DUF6531 domain-containing protein n=2 Tax=Actinomycetaceae TaxID=2049 RepID=A0ABZ0RA28_9ACTO|nr:MULTISPECIES: DUF6531 domain-containing protein [Actinotignum]MDK6644735.1 DUF6531 domain-containing protein [Actinotignum timonense]WPJ88473.1 DUF6531 domain-containing protein [Schaalia turicensis]MDE1552275.1 DUF6531 domain-containing protein [Actinotignum sanguinis]MDE1565495.1 DUF6531 domain-containing protein [Actinotignum sanguinis]MDE1577535.1 DUF6531 domain-containing protein [Actinotignum sanguinis]